ncbi:glycosyltransferase family 2 protein [Microbacterium kyungheense]|uniref:Glycosyl transferase family 2 n=1 Tax=Microbacterium kyungheense TaxID=1263636 RepID=A0A543ES46_9MICO|nr:glycosyltransferase family 2 protein [Microbacterium kyungheense]TQM24349.1 glycosyl transferase family 2 [Microbacterium kyungheense]
MATLSVVIPSLNDAEMLRHCLAALAAQTRAPDEIIVVDNGSDDDTAEVARGAGARVVDEPVRGVLRATSAGFDAARGEIIGRLDADSRPAPDWAARLDRRFSADPTLTALTGTGTFYGGSRFWHFVGHHVYLGGYLFVFRAVIGHIPLFGSNFAIRRDAWRGIRPRVHLDDPHAHDDLDISLVLPPDAGIEFDPWLHVQVSARPFQNWAGFARRASWAFHIVGVNLREVPWLRRVWRCAQGRRDRRRRQRELGLRHPHLAGPLRRRRARRAIADDQTRPVNPA